MKTAQALLKNVAESSSALQALRTTLGSVKPDLVLAFGSIEFFETPVFLAELKRARFRTLRCSAVPRPVKSAPRVSPTVVAR